MMMRENEKKKEYLRQYRIHVRRIHRINAEIAELRSMKISPSMNNDGMPHGSSQGDLSGYAAELDCMVSELIKERYVRMVEYQEIVRQIKRLRSENEKDVLFYRYIRGMDWWEIAEKMKFSSDFRGREWKIFGFRKKMSVNVSSICGIMITSRSERKELFGCDIFTISSPTVSVVKGRSDNGSPFSLRNVINYYELL